MLALDHQENFRKLAGNDLSIIDLKRQILQALQYQYSAVLIDCEFGLPAYSGINKPYLLRLEKSVPPDENGVRKTELAHSVEDLKNQGASGVKFLVFVDPTSQASLTMNKEIALLVLADCQRSQLPLFLEIITYEQSGQKKKGELVLAALDFFLKNGIVPAVFKLEYPGNADFCQKVTDCLSATPWILLSGGADFQTFKEQLTQAVAHGASGFLAGRAVWQDIINYQGEKRDHYLQEILPDRFSQLNKITLKSW
jgi:tagatose-1,6-bisphosphate aldolase